MSTGEDQSFLARWGQRIMAGVLSLGTLLLLTMTLSDYGMVWDEGFTVEREERLLEWFARVTGDRTVENRAWTPTLSKLESRSSYLKRAGASSRSPWSRESLRFYWQFAREEPNGHPPFYALLGLAGWAVGHHALPPPASYRLGPAVLFSVTIGALYWFVARRYGNTGGLMAASGLLSMPRVFAHAHLASYDVPTLCLWFLATLAFHQAVARAPGEGRPWAWTIAFGLAWGCAMATKLTGWFIPVPLIVWVVLYRDLRGVRTLALGGVVAAVVLYAQIPTWWANPFRGLEEFFRSNLTRQNLAPIPTLFLGRIYRFSLPWYNTLVWTAIVVPPLTLVLSLIGAGQVVFDRLRDRVGTLLLGCWVFMLLLRALPNAPGHDGARLFLPAFIYQAGLAGLGLTTVGAWLRRMVPPRIARWLTAGALGVAISAGAWSTWLSHPLQLSYYNALIGGLSGASKAGMEPTYYWDALTPDLRDWLNTNTQPGDSVSFVFPAVTFEYLHRWGLLEPYPLATRDQLPRWFIVMNRPGHLQFVPKSLGQYLLDHGDPVLVETLNTAPNVPLISIFRGEDMAEAARIVSSILSSVLKRPEQPAGPQNSASEAETAPAESSTRGPH